MFEHVREVVGVELGGVAEQLEAGRLLAVEDPHPEHDGAALERVVSGHEAT